jgi:biopolymer transport protein ExbB/TolQ
MSVIADGLSSSSASAGTLPVDRERRGRTALMALAAGIVFIGVVSSLLPQGTFFATLLFGNNAHTVTPYPFTFQNLIELIFFVGLGELLVRRRVGKREADLLRANLLPEDEMSVLTIADLGPIRERARNLARSHGGYLAQLVNLLVLQLQSNRSVDQAVAVLNSSLDIQSHKVELRYAMVRYIVWIIPTLGFIGTVTSLGGALRLIDPQSLDVSGTTSMLGEAFNTTALALIESAILVFLQHVVGTQEEETPSQAAEYCLVNLINRIYIEPADRA